jgi:hypothetical protein
MMPRLRGLRGFYRGSTPARITETGQSFPGYHVIYRVGGVRYLVANAANTANPAKHPRQFDGARNNFPAIVMAGTATVRSPGVSPE